MKSSHSLKISSTNNNQSVSRRGDGIRTAERHLLVCIIICVISCVKIAQHPKIRVLTAP